MSTFQSFSLPANNDTLACSTKAASVALSGTGDTILVSNVTTVEAFIAAGDSTVTVVAGGSSTKAADGGTSVPGGTTLTFSVPDTVTHLAGITGASTTTLRISRGSGG